ncbi:hypothetical protein NKG94_26790 [Micromonospora sp. M12]
MGSRLRRTVELLVGVVLGLAVGDALMPLFGIGAWQTGVVVVLAIIVAILLKGGDHCSPRPAALRCSSPPWNRPCGICPFLASSTPRSAGWSGWRSVCWWCPSTRSGRCDGWPNPSSIRPSPPCTTWPGPCVAVTSRVPRRVWTACASSGPG